MNVRNTDVNHVLEVILFLIDVKYFSLVLINLRLLAGWRRRKLLGNTIITVLGEFWVLNLMVVWRVW